MRIAISLRLAANNFTGARDADAFDLVFLAMNASLLAKNQRNGKSGVRLPLCPI
jgi:hypothetical protein